MKSQWVIGILVLAVLFCQGVAFAESVDPVETIEATAEETVVVDESSLGATDEAAAPADELYAPAPEPVQEEAPEAADEAVTM